MDNEENNINPILTLSFDEDSSLALSNYQELKPEDEEILNFNDGIENKLTGNTTLGNDNNLNDNDYRRNSNNIPENYMFFILPFFFFFNSSTFAVTNLFLNRQFSFE